MASCCVGTGSTVKEFTFLLVHVLHVSHPAALEGSTHYTREIVDGFFKKYTSIDVSYIEGHNHKFRNLTAESRLEIVFAGRPKGYKVLNYKIYKYEHAEGLRVAFEVEVRLFKRYNPPHCDYDLLEIERTDYLPLSGCMQRHIEDMRVPYMNA